MPVATKPKSEPVVPSDTFQFALPEGVVLTVGRPRGVLKLKLRDILSSDLLKDPEIVAIATAFLAIRDVGGAPIMVRTYSDFVATMNRFGSDETLDEFMTAYQKFIDPVGSQIISDVIAQAVEEHLSADEMTGLITQRVMAHQLEQRAKAKN